MLHNHESKSRIPPALRAALSKAQPGGEGESPQASFARDFGGGTLTPAKLEVKPIQEAKPAGPAVLPPTAPKSPASETKPPVTPVQPPAVAPAVPTLAMTSPTTLEGRAAAGPELGVPDLSRPRVRKPRPKVEDMIAGDLTKKTYRLRPDQYEKLAMLHAMLLLEEHRHVGASALAREAFDLLFKRYSQLLAGETKSEEAA
jgi:hypothetical protein